MHRRIDEVKQIYPFGCECSTPNSNETNFFLSRKLNHTLNPSKPNNSQINKHKRVPSTAPGKVSLKDHKQHNNSQRGQQTMSQQRNREVNKINNCPSIHSSTANPHILFNRHYGQLDQPGQSAKQLLLQTPNKNPQEFIPHAPFSQLQLKFQPIIIARKVAQPIIKFQHNFIPLQHHLVSQLPVHNHDQSGIKKCPSRDTTIVPSNTESQKHIGLIKASDSYNVGSNCKQPPCLPSFEDDLLQIYSLQNQSIEQTAIHNNKMRQDATQSLMSSSPLNRHSFKSPSTLLTRSYRTQKQVGFRRHRMSEVEEIISMKDSNESNDGDAQSIVLGRMAQWDGQEDGSIRSKCESFLIFNE